MSALLSAELERFVDEQIVGVLATRSGEGRVHQSLVYYARHGDELLVSTLAGRRKALDVEATGWASLCVMAHERPFASVTVSGAAELRRTGIGDATASVMQRVLGAEEAPEAQTDEALAGVGRVIVAVRIEHVGPATYVEPG